MADGYESYEGLWYEDDEGLHQTNTPRAPHEGTFNENRLKARKLTTQMRDGQGRPTHANGDIDWNKWDQEIQEAGGKDNWLARIASIYLDRR